jgi:hypothetical protein
MNTARAALLFVMGIMCTGCLELTQEIWVNADGSGRMKLDISLPQGLMAMAAEAEGGNPFAENQAEYDQLKAHPEQVPNLRSLDHSEYVEGEFHHFVIELEVEDVTLLPETMEALQARTSVADEDSGETGEIASPNDMRLERLGRDRMLFVQTLVDESMVSATGTAEPGMEEMEAASQAFLASMFAGKFYTVRVHAPRISSANGTVDEAAQTAEWKIPLGDVMSQQAPRELRAEIELASH